jgi:hypothetical protein
MPRSRRSNPLIPAVLALGLAVLAAGWLALWPCVYRGVFAEVVDGVRTVRITCDSLVDVNGAGVLALLALPVVLTALGVWAVRTASSRMLWIAAVLLLVFCLVSGFSVGLWFLPASIALLLCALTPRPVQASD